jgi:hypothetical protein
MGAAEEQLKKIVNSPEQWDIPALAEVHAAAGRLVEVMGEMSQIEWKGNAAEAATTAFEALRKNFGLLEQATDTMMSVLVVANEAKAEAARELEGLSSGSVDPAIATAARTASAVVFRGMTLPADGAINFIEGLLGDEREKDAERALQHLESNLETRREGLAKAVQVLKEYEPVMPGVQPPDIPEPSNDDYRPSSPSYPTSPTPSYPGGGGGGGGAGGGGAAVGVGLFPTPGIVETPTHFLPNEPGRPSVDGDVTGTLPGHPTTGLPGGTSHLPGGSSHFPGGSGGTGGSVGSGIGTGGTGGLGGSGGLGAGLIGGGAGAAAVAAKLRLGGAGAGGLGGASSVRGGMSGLSGTNGASARLGAGGLGGAGGVGAGGSAGSAGGGATGAGANGAGANGAAGNRLGGGGLLGSQPGAAAAGGNGSTVTSTTTGTAGGRGTGMMGGGGAGSDEKERRVGLGGLMAPKLDDESDAAPRSAGASAGGRDEQPQD